MINNNYKNELMANNLWCIIYALVSRQIIFNNIKSSLEEMEDLVRIAQIQDNMNLILSSSGSAVKQFSLNSIIENRLKYELKRANDSFILRKSTINRYINDLEYLKTNG